MNNSSKVIKFLVSNKEQGLRVDKAFSLYDDTLSRSYIKKLILRAKRRTKKFTLFKSFLKLSEILD